ncbi:MAG TPA: hypothetical protein P5181_03345 [Dermatophilaceae bacterium]|nr:hypothetical protein [Dermatophilaceae bacterium]
MTEPRREPDEEDLDARFEQIIAGWDDIPDLPEPSRQEQSAQPEQSEQPARPDRPVESPGTPGDSRLGGAPAAYLGDDDLGWRGYRVAEPDEHFEPPEPQLPPAHDATYWISVAGIVLGPLIVVWAVMFSGNPDPGWWVLTGIAATAVGFGLLVLRGSGERDPDDDGAQV